MYINGVKRIRVALCHEEGLTRNGQELSALHSRAWGRGFSCIIKLIKNCSPQTAIINDSFSQFLPLFQCPVRTTPGGSSSRKEGGGSLVSYLSAAETACVVDAQCTCFGRRRARQSGILMRTDRGIK